MHKPRSKAKEIVFLEPNVQRIAEHIPLFVGRTVPVIAIDRRRMKSYEWNHERNTGLFRAALKAAGVVRNPVGENPRFSLRAHPLGMHIDYQDRSLYREGKMGISSHTSSKKAHGIFGTAATWNMTDKQAGSIGELYEQGLYDPNLSLDDFYAADIPRGVTTMFRSSDDVPTPHDYQSMMSPRDFQRSETIVEVPGQPPADT